MGSQKRSFISEDWLSLWTGLFVYVMSLKLFVRIDMQGWGVKTGTLIKISHSAITISKNYKSLCRIILLILFMYACQTLSLYNNKQRTKSFLKY